MLKSFSIQVEIIQRYITVNYNYYEKKMSFRIFNPEIRSARNMISKMRILIIIITIRVRDLVCT